MKTSPWTRARIALLLDLGDDGLSLSDQAEELGVTRAEALEAREYAKHSPLDEAIKALNARQDRTAREGAGW